jgi:hypothetical protein
MLVNYIINAPLEFIKENLTGWVILILAVLILYFICLRNYYKRKEQFYDQAILLKEMKNIEKTEKNILADENNYKKEQKRERAVLQNSNLVSSDFDQPPLNGNNKSKNKSHTIKSKQVIEGFVDESVTNTQPIVTPTLAASIILDTVSTTLFDNLGLTDKQLLDCKANYNNVIATMLIDLGNLNASYSRNRFINVKKQYDSILAKGIDNIVNYLANPIKSPRVITRTAIRTDVTNVLNSVLDNLINKTNNEISEEMNRLVIMNSTTIDYNSQLNGITELRNKVERYIGIDKLIGQFGNNVSISNREINNILDRSYILPIYERNYDKITQLVKSDFNDNEADLSSKYGKAYTDFLEQQKRDELNVNPLSLASKIESGIVSILENVNSNATMKTNMSGSISTEYQSPRTEVVEQMTRDYGFIPDNKMLSAKNNPIPIQESALFNSGINSAILNSDNIISDKGSRGAYLVDSKTQKTILEGFETTTTTSSTTTSSTTAPSLLKALDNSNTNSNNKNKNNGDIVSNLFSSDFLQYMLDKINEYMGDGYNMYKMQVNSYFNNSGMSSFKMEDNMIPFGFLLFILSMLIYFIDVTS